MPNSLFNPRNVPLPLCPRVQEELNRMKSIGRISKFDDPIRHVGSIEKVGHSKVGVVKDGTSYPLNNHLFGAHFVDW